MSRREEEKILVDRALDGDDLAFRELVERYQRRVYALAYGILRDREDAWDVAQEAFVKAYRNLARFEGNAAFYTWLYRIAYNLSMDALRARARRDVVDMDDSRVADVAASSDDAPRDADPAHVADRKELAAVIRQAMSKLSDKHRAIIVLREIEGLSYEEMAEVLKISKGTVMSRLFHARKNLQKLLAPYVEDGSASRGSLAPEGAS